MNQLVITHADGTTSVYPVSDTSVLIIDGQSVSLAGVTAVAMEEAPAPVVEPAAVEAVPEPQPAPEPPAAEVPAAPAAEPAAPAAEPAVAPEAAPPAAPADPPQPATVPDGQQP